MCSTKLAAAIPRTASIPFCHRDGFSALLTRVGVAELLMTGEDMRRISKLLARPPAGAGLADSNNDNVVTLSGNAGGGLEESQCIGGAEAKSLLPAETIWRRTAK